MLIPQRPARERGSVSFSSTGSSQPEAGQRAAVLGLGVSNRALAGYLLDVGLEVWVYDQQASRHLGARWTEIADRVKESAFGEQYLDEFSQDSRDFGFDWVFATPGMPKDLPQIRQARRQGANISSELALFMQQCPAIMVGITGSSGKTTTTAMVGDMLRAGLDTRVWVGGNIGTTLIDRLADISPDDVVVLEISSFQLELATRTTEYGAILNISPNHLDVHGDMDSYVQAKSRLLICQPPGSLAVLNWDCERTRQLSSLARGRLAYYSMQQAPESWDSSRPGELAGWQQDGHLWVKRNGEVVRLCSCRDIPLRGPHNVANTLIAGLVSSAVGGSIEGMREAISAFCAVPHRLEEVTCRDGVLFINDSIATSPDRTAAALDSFDRPLILIMGGYDKGISFAGLAEKLVKDAAHEQIRAVVLTGATSCEIQKNLLDAASKADGFSWVEEENPETNSAVLRVESEFERAVRLAGDLARRGDIVLLSPACASFDQFDNFITRGRNFRDIVTG